MVMEDGSVTNFKLGSSFMHPASTCYSRITCVYFQTWSIF